MIDSAIRAVLATSLIVALGEAASTELARNRAKLRSMSTSDVRQLQQNLAQFEALTPDEQAKLRKLHQSLIDSGVARQDLEATMNRYMRWLDTLSPSSDSNSISLKTPVIGSR